MVRIKPAFAAFVTLSLLVASSMVAPAAAQTGAPNSPSVTTEGRASIKVAPDMAWISVTAESRAAKPAEAQSANAQAIDTVRASLRAAGVKDESVKTRSYNVEAQMQYTNGKATVVGYIAQQSLDVRVDVLGNLGKVIDAAGSTGATSISDIRYDTERRAAIEREAITLAVKDGLARAEAMAAGAGRSVLSVWRIDDQRSSSGFPRPAPMVQGGLARAQVETAISPSELEIQASVSVTVILK